MVLMVLLDSLVTVSLHKFLLNLGLWVGNVFANQYSYDDFVMVCKFIRSCYCWVCWCFLGTGFWNCIYVFDPGVCDFFKLLCTTDERVASCAGHLFVVCWFGWLCTTGINPLFCADNLYWLTWSQMSLMSNKTEFVIAIRFSTFLFSIWSSDYSYDGWVCCCLLGTGFWKCNLVFDPGDCGSSKLLCTTDERIASCAGHHFVVRCYGWLCTTGTDSLFCAGNLYWMILFHMSRMSMETVVVIDTRFIPNLFIFWKYCVSRSISWRLTGCYFMAGIVICVVLFVYWWGYKVVCVSRSCALFIWIFWYSNVNFPCTLFPCSKFSHRVFIWQGFLMRQGSWMIEDLMFHPYPDLRCMLMLIWVHFHDQAFWCCNADMLFWKLYLFGLF